MPLFDVPFLPDPEYGQFLVSIRDRLHSCHFSLETRDIPDARFLVRTSNIEDIITGLSLLPGVKKYALVNGRFSHPSRYMDKNAAEKTAGLLEHLLEASVLDGIVFSDLYFLLSLSRARPGLCRKLEAVPSVNAMADTWPRLSALLDAVSHAGFKAPAKLNLDRSLNRDLEGLAKMYGACKKHLPGTNVTLLANEGCLLHCPFKLSHDALISLANTGLAPENTAVISRELGCVRYVHENPAELFKSPFILPGDVDKYGPYCDIIKICGRTLGPRFLMRTITAYLEGTLAGSLLDILDAMEPLAGVWQAPGPEIPGDFFETVTSCAKQCRACGYCRNLADRLIREKGPALRDLRGKKA